MDLLKPPPRFFGKPTSKQTWIVDSNDKKVYELKEWLEQHKVESIAEHAPKFSAGAIPGVLTSKNKQGLIAANAAVTRLRPKLGSPRKSAWRPAP